MNILIVDDEVLELDQLELFLSPHFPNWTIYRALDASQALKISDSVTIHLAFLDIKLPGKSGLELAEILSSQFEHIDIVMVTAFQSFPFMKQSIRLGVIDYITKPIIEEEFNFLLEKYKSKLSEKHPIFIQEALNYIHINYNETMSLSSIAEEVYVNPSYLSRSFHKELGMPISLYIKEFRIKKAKELLRLNSQKNIADIAAQTGFKSQSYFSKTFRELEGMSPFDYMKKEVEE